MCGELHGWMAPEGPYSAKEKSGGGVPDSDRTDASGLDAAEASCR